MAAKGDIGPVVSEAVAETGVHGAQQQHAAGPSTPSAGSSRSVPAGGLRSVFRHGPPGRPAASLITLSPDTKNGAATISLPSGSAAMSPAGKS